MTEESVSVRKEVTPGSSGRSRSAIKREAILCAARELFLEHGFAEASIDAVTAKAGVSKSTIYGHFGTKEELFHAIVSMRAEHVLNHLESLRNPSGDPSTDLEAFAVAFQRVILAPEALAWHRLVIGEAARQPQLAQSLFNAGPAKVLGLVEAYLSGEADRGRLQIDSPAEAAEHFLGLIIGLDFLRGQMGSLQARSDSECRQRAQRVVAVFMAAYGGS